MWVLPIANPFELPNSSPAEGPAGRSLLLGEAAQGKKVVAGARRI